MLSVFIFLVITLIGFGINRRASSIYDIPRFMLVMSIGSFIEAIRSYRICNIDRFIFRELI